MAVGQEEQARPLSISARLGHLQFHHSGKFRVLQLADLQDGPKVAADTVKLITAAVQVSRPDLVIFSGNQIAGYDPAYADTYRRRHWRTPAVTPRREVALANTRKLVRESIAQVVQPLNDMGVPWAVTYGNHDFQCGLSNAELDTIYREFDGCVNPDTSVATDDDNNEPCRIANTPVLPSEIEYACEPGTFALPVTDEAGHVVIGIALVDSGDYAPTGGYGSPSQAALQFLEMLPERLGPQAKSMVFQHTPLPQYYDLLTVVPSTTEQAAEGYRMFSGKYYALDPAKTQPGGYLGEGISAPDDDSGEFDILTSGGYFAIATGHDHRNAFDGESGGLRMIATPTCGFDSYGPIPARRAARLFEFDIRHPFEPRTQLLEFGDLVGKPSSNKAYVYGMAADSKPASEGVNLLHKPNGLTRWWHWVEKSIFGR